MKNINTDNADAVISAAQEILESGQLWIELDGEQCYIPELITNLQTLINLEE